MHGGCRLGAFCLRDGRNKLAAYLSKEGTHYNDHIVVTGDVLINKTDGNRQSRIQGYLDDGILVLAERGIGYQQVFADGRRGEHLDYKPREASGMPDWERLGLRSLGAELREEVAREKEERLLDYCRSFMSAVARRNQALLDEMLDGSFQVSHGGHTASRPEFIVAEDVRFHGMELLLVAMQREGDLIPTGKPLDTLRDGILFTGQVRVKYQLLRSRHSATEVYDFRLRMKWKKIGWCFTRAWFGR